MSHMVFLLRNLILVVVDFSLVFLDATELSLFVHLHIRHILVVLLRRLELIILVVWNLV